MLDVCYISPARGYGGAEIYLETLMAGCEDAGLRCLILVSRENIRFLSALASRRAAYSAISMADYGLGMYIQLYKAIKKNKPAILHINLPGPWGGQLVPLVGKVAGAASVVTTEHLPMFGPSIRHSPIKRIDGMFVSHTITVSHDNVRYLKELHHIEQRKISVVHNGVDAEKYRGDGDQSNRDRLRQENGFSESDFVFGIVGRITEQKGHRYALQALALLGERCPDLKIAILGEGELLAECKALTKSLCLDSRVHYIGFQSDMGDAYRMLDGLLMPSLFEALPLTLLEGMASALPVIASNIHGIPEVIEDGVNGQLVPPKDVTSLMNAMERIYSDRSFSRNLAVSARQTIEEEFSIQKMVDNTISIYSRVSPHIDATTR